MENVISHKYKNQTKYNTEILTQWEGQVDWRLHYLISLSPLL